MSHSEAVGEANATVFIVADDSRLRAHLVEVAGTHGFKVLGDVRTGYEAIRLIHETSPDVIGLDIGDPGSRAADVLEYIAKEARQPLIIMAEHGRIHDDAGLAQVDFGNVEFVVKPTDDADRELIGRRFLAALDAITTLQIGGTRMNRAKRAAARAARAAQRAARAGMGPGGPAATSAVAIAASTGGPRALLEIIPGLEADFPAAVLIVQHMPQTFTSLLADRLARLSALEVREAAAGEVLRAGTVYLARGGYHMGLQRTAAGISITLDEGEPVWGLRPAADVLFGAVARNFGPRSLGVVLTGMGKDGAAGLRAIQEVGGWTAVQDSDSAVLGSMPDAARPYAKARLPLGRVARVLRDQLAQLDRSAD